MKKNILIAPSILSADFGKLTEEVQRVEKAKADWIHFDVMDGHFVPNISIGPLVLKAIKNSVNMLFDVHLMISHPRKYVDAFIDAGADSITIHSEACSPLRETIEYIKSRNIKAGPVINPDQPVKNIEHVLDISDIVLVMSVFPGFGGQKFIPDVLPKIEHLKKLRNENNYSYLIQIDGGINCDNISQCAQAGIDVAVAGTAVYGSMNIEKTIQQLKHPE